MSAIAVNHFVVTALVRSGVTATDAAKVLDAFHTAAGPVAVLFMLGPIVYLLASVAASRAGLVPKAAIILGVLFLIVSAVPTALAQMLSFGVGFALTAWIAKAMLQTRQRSRHGTRAPRARHPRECRARPDTVPAAGLPVR